MQHAVKRAGAVLAVTTALTSMTMTAACASGRGGDTVTIGQITSLPGNYASAGKTVPGSTQQRQVFTSANYSTRDG